MSLSILETVRDIVAPNTGDHFDGDLIIHINSVLMELNMIGVGPTEGFFISDEDATWADFIMDNKKIEAVKSYVAIKVQLIFDPPQTSYAIAAAERTVERWEWHLKEQSEPDRPVVDSDGEE